MRLTKVVNIINNSTSSIMSNTNASQFDAVSFTRNTRSSSRSMVRINYDETATFYGNAEDANLTVTEYKASSKPILKHRQKCKGNDNPKLRIKNLQAFFTVWGDTININVQDAATYSQRIMDSIESLKWTCITESDVDCLKIPAKLSDASVTEFRLRLFDNHHLSIKRSHFIKNVKHPWGLFAGSKSFKFGK